MASTKIIINQQMIRENRLSITSKRAQFVFATAWELANRKERIVVDKKVILKYFQFSILHFN